MKPTSKNRIILFAPALASALLSGVGIYLLAKGISYDLACFMLIFFGLATLVSGYDALTRDTKKSHSWETGEQKNSTPKEKAQTENQFLMTESR